jgi:UDP-glucose 4-epimerase
VRAIVGLSQSPEAVGEVFNIGSTEEVTIQNLAERVKRLTGSTSEVVYVPYEEAYEAGFEDMRRRIPDTSKIQRVINWKPRHSLDATLSEVIRYFQERDSQEEMPLGVYQAI